MSCSTLSIDELARTTPVRPPIVNRKTNPSAHKQAALYVIRVPYNVASHMKILIPVGTVMIIIADVKYARVSMSIPTVNMWCAHTTNSSNPIAIIAKIIPKFPNASLFRDKLCGRLYQIVVESEYKLQGAQRIKTGVGIE